MRARATCSAFLRLALLLASSNAQLVGPGGVVPYGGGGGGRGATARRAGAACGSLLRECQLAYYNEASKWSMVLARRPEGYGAVGRKSTEWMFVDKKGHDKFGHAGETIIPGAGDSWSHAKRRPPFGPADATDAAGDGDDDDFDELPWQVIYIGDPHMVRRLQRQAAYHRQVADHALLGHFVDDHTGQLHRLAAPENAEHASGAATPTEGAFAAALKRAPRADELKRGDFLDAAAARAAASAIGDGADAATLEGKHNHYLVLGLSRDSGDEELRKAYRTASRVYHPDRHGGSNTMFTRVSAAHDCLADAKLRKAYDRGDDLERASARQQAGAAFSEVRKRDVLERKRREAPPRPGGPDIPGGSYRGSCKGCAFDDDDDGSRVLRCTRCLTGKTRDDFREAAIDPRGCQDDEHVGNNQGTLICERKPDEPPQPPPATDPPPPPRGAAREQRAAERAASAAASAGDDDEGDVGDVDSEPPESRPEVPLRGDAGRRVATAFSSTD
ncbi:hypothetical protein JL720_9382 [Aureococcus anophagefferens]|nr:hypothetical protein JL720_9382 [Aureococcus anophagefferens]